MFQEFQTKDKPEAERKLNEWLTENPLPNKIEVLNSDKGFFLSSFKLVPESEPITKS
jgi:hypothetical protein